MKSILRQTHQRFILWGFLDLFVTLVAIAGWTLIIAASLRFLNPPTGIEQVGMYLWWVVALILLVWRTAAFLTAFFNSNGILRKIEASHPEYRNELSTLRYLDTHDEEVDQLGFSPSLIAALRREVQDFPEPQWVRLGLSPKTRRNLLGIGAVGGVALVCFPLLAPDLTNQLARTHLYGQSEAALHSALPLDLPAHLEVPYKHDLTLSPRGSDPYLSIDFGNQPEGSQLDLLAKTGEGAWKAIGSLELGEKTRSKPLVLRIEQETRICFSGISGMSSICRILPVYPPAVRETTVRIEPPSYTKQSIRTEQDPTKVEGLESSQVEIVWRSDASIEASTLEILSPTQSVLRTVSLDSDSKNELRHQMELAGNDRLRLSLSDRFGQKGLSKVLQLTAVADGPPEAEILSPTREVILPPDLQVPIKMTARDDIGLSSVELVYRLDNGMPAGGARASQILAENLAGNIGGATPFLVETTLDLSQLDLWPGDQVVYWFEVYDYRGDLPSRKGISPTYFVRFPTVEENLDEMASVREKSVDGLQELLDEQQQINRQFEEIRKDLQRNRENLSDADVKFDAQKKIADTLQREEDLQKKLEEAGDQLDQTLQRLSEDDSQALRTLHKFQRVQELMEELMTEESKKILQELQETLQKLQKEELRPEELEQTEDSLEDFEKQLDRQLALLENIWLEQEAEALKEQAEELAQRQEELKEATVDQLSAEEKAEVEREMADSEKDIEAPEENLQERLDETIDRLEEALEEKKDSESSEPPSESSEGKQEPSPQAEDLSTSEQQESEQVDSETEQPNLSEKESTEPQESKPEEASAPDESEESPDKLEEESKDGLKDTESEEKEDQEARSSQEEPQSPEPSDPQETQAMADRQEQLNRETDRLLEELKRLTEKANEKEHQMAEKLNEMNQGEMCDSIQGAQQSAQSELKKNQMKQAAKSQSKAGQKMQQMAQSLESCCSGSGPDMQEIMAKMREILDRSFILSVESEQNDQTLSRYKGLAEWPNVDRMSRLGTEMGWYRQEASRLSAEFSEIAKENPFAEFEVVKNFDRASNQWKQNTQMMEEDAPISVSLRSHQALSSVNLAIEKLIESIDETSSQSQSSSGLEGYFQGIKQMLSEQKGINEQTQQLKDQMGRKPGDRMPGSEGEGLSPGEQMKKIAQQQAATRRQLKALEEKYRGMKNKSGSLDGVGEQMQQVENELEQGMMGDRVTDLQENIVQRLLDAEKSIHNQGYKKKRKALRTDGELVEESPSTLPNLLEGEDEEDLARLLRKDLDQVSPHWRDRIRKYYDNLLQP